MKGSGRLILGLALACALSTADTALARILPGGGQGNSGGSGQTSQTYEVTVEITGQGTVTAVPSNLRPNKNTSAKLTLNPVQGWFLQAASGCGGSVSGNQFTTAVRSTDCQVNVTFAPNVHAVAGLPNPPGSGAVFCLPIPVTDGGNVTCTFVAQDGYQFAGWSGACQGALPTCRILGVTSNGTVYASFNPSPPPASLCHVRSTASGSQTGASWQDAYRDLASALEQPACVEIHVAAGVYTATDNPADQQASFHIGHGVKIKGGFPAEGGDVRDPVANKTVLSGDIDNDDDTDGDGVVPHHSRIRGGNSFNVVTIEAPGEDVSLDGFIVTGGSASSAAPRPSGGGIAATEGNSIRLKQMRIVGNAASGAGGGVHLSGVSPAFEEVEVSGNFAASAGGGVACASSSRGCNPSFANTTFHDNATDGLGGALATLVNGPATSSPSLVNVTFSSNAAATGGAIGNDDGPNPTGTIKLALRNVTMAQNQATTRGGAIGNATGQSSASSATLDNVIAWDNTAPSGGEVAADAAQVTVRHSVVAGGCPVDASCEQVLTADPLLGPLQDNGGFSATMVPAAAGSAIDSGSDPTTEELDQRGLPRRPGSTDIGAAEAQVHKITLSIFGLVAQAFRLTLNDGHETEVGSNGTFTFPVKIDRGASYALKVGEQPRPSAKGGIPTVEQHCIVEYGTGTATSDIADPLVICTTVAHPVGGQVSGLAGTGLVLQLNGADNLAVAANGGFTFATPVDNLSAFAITVAQQPSAPAQACTVTNGNGIVGSSAVTNVQVQCATRSFGVGGVVDGLAGSGLVLRLNGTHDLPVAADGGFSFGAPVANGAGYAVTIVTEPAAPIQTCSVGNGSGTMGLADVSDVQVTCQTVAHTVGGAVSGLAGTGLALRLNDTVLPIGSNGSFTFPGAIDNGSQYAVVVVAQPGAPVQACAVANGSGVVGTADVTNVAVQCATVTHTVGGIVSGLSGSGLQLGLNGTQALAVSGNGGFAFAAPLEVDATYAVTVSAQPTSPNQTCSIQNASGAIEDLDIDNVVVTCSTNSHTVGTSVASGQGSIEPTSRQVADNGRVQFFLTPDAGWTIASVEGCNGELHTTTYTTGSIGAACTITASFVTERICHVRAAATGGNNGNSWGDAYTDLQDALADAGCTEIRVAAGLYKPTSTADRGISFVLATPLKLYGGYAGTGADPDQRDPWTFPTVLSGDIDGNDASDSHGIVETVDPATNTGNSYHVLTIGVPPHGGRFTRGRAILDGFVVTAGNANSGDNDANGGGLLCMDGSVNLDVCSPTLNQMVFVGNSAVAHGGAIYFDGSGGRFSAPLVTNSEFRNNTAVGGGAPGSGGAISTWATSGGGMEPDILASTFSGNSADNFGGAVHARDTNADAMGHSLNLTNLTFSGNTAGAGGAVALTHSGSNFSGIYLRNTTFSGNHATGFGGAIHNDRGTVHLQNSALWGNTAVNSAPVIRTLLGTSHIHNSVLQGASCPNDANCTAIVFADPLLAPLDYYGGLTDTMLPGFDGAAVDAGDDTICTAQPVGRVDQRDLRRPQGDHCDVGAVEAMPHTVGGTVTGLAGSGLALALNGAETLAISANGAFVFETLMDFGTTYAVTLAGEPSSPTQECTLSNASGALVGDDVTDVLVTCTTVTHAVGGSVSGLAGAGLMLRLNGGDLAVGSNGDFTFPQPVANGGSYEITVVAHPSGPVQACSVSNGTGTVGSTDVDDVAVSCTTVTHTVGGTAYGLVASDVTLRLNGGNDLGVAVDGAFAFAPSLQNGASYQVSIASQPSSPAQECIVHFGDGIIGTSDVIDVEVYCETITHTIGGSLTGLVGTGLELALNGNRMPVHGDGSLLFPNSLQGGDAYVVTVARQPAAPQQQCNVFNGEGTVSTDVTTVTVVCGTPSYRIGGLVSGLDGDGLVLRLNGAHDLAVARSGAFAFGTVVQQGTGYDVEVVSQPARQTCVATAASGTVGAGDVGGITVNCTTLSTTIFSSSFEAGEGTP